MRVGIDIRPLAGASGKRGVGAYIRGLLSGFAGRTDGAEIILFGNGSEEMVGLPSVFDCVRLVRPRRGITLWDQIAWPPLLARRRIGLFHSPFYALPRLRPPGCRAVQTVHDLTPLKIPGSVSPRNARIFRANFRLARTADRIIVPSAATRRDVVELLGVHEAKVTIIPEATDITPEEARAARADLPATRARLGLSKERPYLLHTGGHDIVKNLGRLVEAFALLAREGRDLDLVIAGEHGSDTATVIARAGMMGLLDRVRLPGYVRRQDLIALYAGCAALVYPSLAEGFGLPVLEAMACGAPVVAADCGSLPEVAGSAGLLVPPSDVGALAAAIGSILDDPALSVRLSREGTARAAGFSWEETARRTLRLYREVAG